jgi:branched-subunit amino acid aminotransferase/4-amino-4-deoxychorismate lyase
MLWLAYPIPEWLVSLFMYIPVMIQTAAGELIEAPYKPRSMEEASHLEPAGIYTIARTYHGDKVILMEAHFDRLEESARMENIPLHLNRENIRSALRSLIRDADFNDSRFRLTIPRDQPDQLILAVEPLRFFTETLPKDGVTVATRFLPRNNPRAKYNEWVKIRSQARRRLPPEVYEGIRLTADDVLTEGFSSNFYAVDKGILRTAEEDVLYGIARRIVLTVAPEILPVEFNPVTKAEIANLDETFLTSISRGVVPILWIDDQQIGDGKPGPKTQAIALRYDTWVEAHLEPI